jgi:hypothetical protein
MRLGQPKRRLELWAVRSNPARVQDARMVFRKKKVLPLDAHEYETFQPAHKVHMYIHVTNKRVSHRGLKFIPAFKISKPG